MADIIPIKGGEFRCFSCKICGKTVNNSHWSYYATYLCYDTGEHVQLFQDTLNVITVPTLLDRVQDETS